jgi:hypothetical protein
MRAQFISENLRFQRGLDPKRAMGIGNKEAQAQLFFKPYIEVLKELKQTDFKKIKYIKFHNKDWENKLIKNFEEFYIEFQYGSLYVSVGIDDGNTIQIPNKHLSKKEIRNLLVSTLLDY